MISHYPVNDLLDLKKIEILDHILKDEKKIFLWRGIFFYIEMKVSCDTLTYT